jgi:glycine cleavage system H protein
MSKDKEPKKESKSLTRREFIKEAGLAVGGIAISSIALQSACSSSNKTVASTTQPTTTSSGSAKTVASTTQPTTTSTGSAQTVASTTQPTTTSTGYKYIPANTPIPLEDDIPGSICMVATDRLYSEEHIWVLSVADDIVVLGISDSFSAKLKPSVLTLEPAGNIITKGKLFGTIEGSKLSADLTSPVTGTVIDINVRLMVKSNLTSAFATPPEGNPYGDGWMMAVRISNPAELKDLLTPEQYLKLLGK